MDGTVTAFTGKEISIITSDNDKLTFDMTKAELDCKSGIIPGNEVTLIYVGPWMGRIPAKSVLGRSSQRMIIQAFCYRRDKSDFTQR